MLDQIATQGKSFRYLDLPLDSLMREVPDFWALSGLVDKGDFCFRIKAFLTSKAGTRVGWVGFPSPPQDSCPKEAFTP